MTNKEVAAILNEIAQLLDLSGESPFKGRAYENVARQIERLEEDLATLANEGRLREIKGVGDALEQKLTELVTTGALQYHQDLRAQFPDSLFELFVIPGLGPKRIKTLYDQLGIASLAAMEKACLDGSLNDLKGFGPKMVAKILEGIEFARKHTGLFLFNTAYEEAKRLLQSLSKIKSVTHIEVAGSLRRRKEVVKDIDLVASSAKPDAVMKRFVEHSGVARITGHGDTKSSIVLDSGIAADLRVVTREQFPYAWLHFTGSKDHNVVLRQRAKDRGWKLSEYGLFEGDNLIACKDEAAIYKALDLPFIPPELREDAGEFDAPVMPRLVTDADIIGVFHCHSTYSDGKNTIEQMARAAQERGYQYMTMTDHSQSAAYAGGLQPERVVQQQLEIDALNKGLKGFRLLKGIESDIRSNGDLDYDNEILGTFDLVIASVHSQLAMTEEQATKRLIKAVESPYTTILGHPSGRLLLARDGFPINYEKLFDACAANNVAVEINANCRRLDLDWRFVRRARDKGLKLVIGPDAHRIEGLDDIQFGVGIARKGWLEPGDLLNCMTLKEFLSWKR